VLVCPACGEGNSEHARFCLLCGESLTVAEKFIGDAVMAVFGASGRCGEAKALREGQAIFAKLGASPVVAQAA
jgi:class 3 adenylate cyclase